MRLGAACLFRSRHSLANRQRAQRHVQVGGHVISFSSVAYRTPWRSARIRVCRKAERRVSKRRCKYTTQRIIFLDYRRTSQYPISPLFMSDGTEFSGSKTRLLSPHAWSTWLPLRKCRCFDSLLFLS